MRAAFVVMSILGCDASGVQCQPVATIPQQWPTIASCDAASDRILSRYSKVKFPLVVAVCQTAGTTALMDSEAEAQENATPIPDRSNRQKDALAKPHRPGITRRAIALLQRAIPTREGIRSTLSLPIHIVTDTYSWVAKEVKP